MVPLVGVVISMVASDDAAHGLTQGRFEKAVSLVGHQASQLHHLVRDDAVGTCPSEKLIGIPGGSQASFIIQRRLLSELHARLELVFPLLSHFHDHTRKFMPDDNRIGVDILGRTFVLLALLCQLIGGHADAVAHDLHQDLILPDLRQFKFLQSQVSRSIHSDCSCLHFCSLLIDSNLLYTFNLHLHFQLFQNRL